jgi:hypothetical protein
MIWNETYAFVLNKSRYQNFHLSCMKDKWKIKYQTRFEDTLGKKITPILSNKCCPKKKQPTLVFFLLNLDLVNMVY